MGIVFASLASVADPALVLPAIAQALDVPETGEGVLTDRLVDVLSIRAPLLILDNFEQVVSGAPVVAYLLANTPRLKVLVTSRVPLRLSGEQEFPVPPLGLPAGDSPANPSALAANDAVALFVDRARALSPGCTLDETNATTIVDICRRLDGLPLAIELAAVRLRFFSPQALLARMSDRFEVLGAGPRNAPERLQTMQAAIGWSY
jgi:predicted ATPase